MDAKLEVERLDRSLEQTKTELLEAQQQCDKEQRIIAAVEKWANDMLIGDELGIGAVIRSSLLHVMKEAGWDANKEDG